MNIILWIVGYLVIGIIVAMIGMFLSDDADFDSNKVGVAAVFWPISLFLLFIWVFGRLIGFLFVRIIMVIGWIFFRDEE